MISRNNQQVASSLWDFNANTTRALILEASAHQILDSSRSYIAENKIAGELYSRKKKIISTFFWSVSGDKLFLHLQHLIDQCFMRF